MNNQEAKFILGAYRPDGRDAGDPGFADALAQAERDPELRQWLERQSKFDAKVSQKINDIVPPAELRAAILAGARASQPRRHWWATPTWLAAAAAVALIVAVSVTVKATRAPAVTELTAFAIKDLAASHDNHVGYPAEFASLQAQLAGAKSPLAGAGGLAIDLDDLRRKNCRTVSIAGREVFEICFQRDGTWFHLYAARRSDFAPGEVDANALLLSAGDYAATAWADSRNVYAIVTRASEEVLRRVI